jgi:hypothetical protein
MIGRSVLAQCAFGMHADAPCMFSLQTAQHRYAFTEVALPCGQSRAAVCWGLGVLDMVAITLLYDSSL